MGFLLATFAVLAFLARSNSAFKLDDDFAATASTFEFIGGADFDDAINLSEFSVKSDAFDDAISTLEHFEDPEDDDSMDSNEFSVEANTKQPDLVVRDLNNLVNNTFFQFN